MVFDRLVIVSGQGATDPDTGELAGSDVETQTRQVFRNMQAILEELHSPIDGVVHELLVRRVVFQGDLLYNLVQFRA